MILIISSETNLKKRKQEEEAPESKASKHASSLGWNAAIKETMLKRTADDLLAQMKDGNVISVKSTDNMYTALLVSEVSTTLLTFHRYSPKRKYTQYLFWMHKTLPSVWVAYLSKDSYLQGFIDTLDIVTAITDILTQGPVGKILFDKDADEDAELTASLIEQQVISSVSDQAVTGTFLYLMLLKIAKTIAK
jgi:hypothetical protein